MTLTTRLLVFFLSMLAVVLVCFCSTLYVFADRYLHERADERLQLVLNMVSSGIEANDEGLEWEPGSRFIELDSPIVEGRFVWVVTDDEGRIVQHSAHEEAFSFLNYVSLLKDRDAKMVTMNGWRNERWRVARYHVESKDRDEFEGKQSAQSERPQFFPALNVTAGLSLTPVEKLLRKLALSLISLSAVVWLIGLGLGRWICRRALLPVTRMATVASEIDAETLAKRLPHVASGDEMEALSHAFNQLLDRLQEAFERQRRFTGEASHQLRTPLTVLLGQIEVSLARERSVGEYQRVLSMLHQTSQHLANVVDSLLFLARADSEAASPAIVDLDLATWLSDYAQSWSTHARFSDIQVRINERDGVVVKAHPVLLGELLNILIDNACKYSHPQTPIEIDLSKRDRGVAISVVDQGCGMNDQERVDLFTPFRRSERARLDGIPGTGLGLSIAKRLATVLGCELSVTSSPNQGSQFCVTFPRDAVSDVL